MNYEAQYNFQYCQFRIPKSSGNKRVESQMSTYVLSSEQTGCLFSGKAARNCSFLWARFVKMRVVSFCSTLLLPSWNVGQTPQIQFHITDITPGIRKRIWNTIASISPSHQAHITSGSLDALQIHCGKLFRVTCPRMAHFPSIFFFVSVAKF